MMRGVLTWRMAACTTGVSVSGMWCALVCASFPTISVRSGPSFKEDAA